MVAVLAGTWGASKAFAAPLESAETIPTFPPGVHRIERDTAFDQTLIIASGSSLLIDKGVTLTIRGDLVAPAEKIFVGKGRVDLNESRLLFARPEWWGAKADDPSIDNVPAFDACLSAHPAMHLGPGDYHVPAGWTVHRSNSRVWGVGRTKDARSTRLLRHGATGAVVTIGQITPPAAINDYVRGVDVRFLELGRTSEPSGLYDEERLSPVGLMVRHALDLRCEGLRANEHAIGYDLRGAVRTIMEDCTAFRSTGGQGAAADQFIGFNLDGRSPPISTGANASLYLIDCNVSLGGKPAVKTSIGCRMLGAMSDTFIVRFETTSLDVGIEIDGLAIRMDENQRGYCHVDILIDMPVLDQCHSAGIRITGMSDEAMMSLRSPYVGLADGATAAIDIRDSGGSIAIDQGQLIGRFAPGSTGLSIAAVSGFSCAGTALQEFSRPIDARSATAFDMVAFINTGPLHMAGAAITLKDCHWGYIRPRIVGGGFQTVVAADAKTEGITVEAAAISHPSTAGDLVTREGRPVARKKDSSAILIGQPISE